MDVIKMAVRTMKKRVAETKRVVAKETALIFLIIRRFLLVPPAIFIFTLIVFYLFSTLFTVSFFHDCISSRKLNLYCVSAGSEPNFLQSMHIEIQDDHHHHHNNKRNNVGFTKVGLPTNISSNSSKKEEILVALKDVEDQIRTLRRWSSSTSNLQRNQSCQGKEIFVYDLPTKFNKDIVKECGILLPWMDFCEFLLNDAMGKPISEFEQNWYQTHQYSLEPIFHSRVSNYPCRVYDPDAAKLFYVPFYGGLDVLSWHFKNVTNEIKDSLGIELIKWLENQNSWARNSGKDHVFVLGKISWDFRRTEKGSWGSNLLELSQMQNPIKLLIERQPWHINDIGIPHPTHFHPRSDQDIHDWQSKIFSSERKHFVSFAGGARAEAPENIRSILIKQCIETEAVCRFLDCNSGECRKPESVIQLFVESEFCLQPPGDSPTRKSVFDALISGCIPVIFDPFTAYYQYPWHLPENHRRYSVFVNQEEVRDKRVNVIEVLRRIPVAEREEMRRFIVYEVMPGLVYADPNSQLAVFQDAFDVSMNNVMDRVGSAKN